MTASYDVRDRETFVVNEPSRRDDGTDVQDRYTVYEFVPRDGTPPRWVVPGDDLAGVTAPAGSGASRAIHPRSLPPRRSTTILP
jgi:hypothetical protein